MTIYLLAFLIGVIAVNLSESEEMASVNMTGTKTAASFIIVRDGQVKGMPSGVFLNYVDLTETLGYAIWDKFLRNYTHFRMVDTHVKFHRNDDLGQSHEIQGILFNFNMTRAPKYYYDIETANDDNFTTIPPKGWSLMTRSDQFFDESIEYELSVFHCQITVSLQKYVKKNHLMLRALYYINLSVNGSTTSGATCFLHSGDEAQFVKLYL